MTRIWPWVLLVAATLMVAGCGGGKKAASNWQPDAGVLKDDGATAMASIPGGEGKVGIKHPKIKPSIRKKDRRKSLLRTKQFQPFKIDKYEVTNHNYYLFLQTLDAETAKKWLPRHHIKGVAHPNWKGSHYKSGKGNHPVAGIPFRAAQAYAQWRGKRLPNEFEWEWAARGKDAKMFGASTDSYATAKTKCNVSDAWTKAPRAVAVNDPKNARDVSPFGAVGMGGNVSEWCTTKESREFNVRKADGKLAKKRLRLNAWRGPNFDSREWKGCILSYQGYMNPRGKTRSDQFQTTLGFRCAK